MAAKRVGNKNKNKKKNKKNEKNIEDDPNKDSLMYKNLQKQKLTEDYGMKCHIRKNATEVIEHQDHNINNGEQLGKNSCHCERIENQEQDESHSEVLEHSEQCASNGDRLDYPEKNQSVSEEVEHTESISSLCEGVEHLEKDQCHSDGTEVTELSPDYSKGIEHPIEYTNDGVEQPNQNLKEGNFQEQSLNHCEGMDNKKQTHSERSKSYIEKIQHLDNFGSEKNKQNKTNDLKEELNDHEASQKHEQEENEQGNEDDLNISTLHTNGNDKENVQDNNSRETSKINEPFTCPHCPRRFKINSLLVIHLPSHTKERVFSCPQCHKFFESDKTLSIHLIGHRTTAKAGPFSCPHCSKEFEDKYSWQRHVFDHEKEGSEYVQACHACKMCFKSNKQFRRHRTKCHRDEVMKEKNETKQLVANITSVCPYCNKEVLKKSLKQHLSTHKERERSYICSDCDKSFLSKFSLARHELLHTTRARPFPCHQCKRRFLSKRHLAVHTVHCLEKLKTSNSSESIRHKCPTCNRGYSTDTILKNHMKIHTKRKKKYVCSVCSKGFFWNHTRTRHELVYHKMIPTVKKNSYMCKICGKYFISQKNLHKHKIIVHAKKNYGCNVCQKKYISEDELKEHEVSHTIRYLVASNTCTECKIEFDSGDALKEHRLVHFKEQIEELNSLKKKSFVCIQCNSNFESQKDLMEHNVIHNKGKTSHSVKKKTDTISLDCSQCNTHFKSKSALKRHELNHKKHTQKMNGNIGKSNKVILNGETSKKNSKTTKEKDSGGKHPFYCSICQKTFTKKGNLTRHMQLHSGEGKIFACHISTCQKTFSHNYYLNRHMKIHSGERKMFTCHICDKIFSTKINLEAHLRSHTDIEEAYLCSECLKIFASRASLKDHIEAVHAKEKLYPCPLCPMKFAYKNIMQKHFLSHRGEEVLSCPHCPKYYESQEDMNWHIIRSHQDIVHKFSYKDEFYYNLRILEEDPKNIDKKEPESTTNIKSKMEKINQNTLKMRKKKCKQIVDKQETDLNKNPVESEWLGNISIDNENSLQECSVILKYQYTYTGIDDTPLTLWL